MVFVGWWGLWRHGWDVADEEGQAPAAPQMYRCEFCSASCLLQMLLVAWLVQYRADPRSQQLDRAAWRLLAVRAIHTTRCTNCVDSWLYTCGKDHLALMRPGVAEVLCASFSTYQHDHGAHASGTRIASHACWQLITTRMQRLGFGT